MSKYIDIDIIISLGLGLEEWLILYSIFTNNEELINKYTNNCKKINTDIFKSLKDKGYIEIKENNDAIYYDLLSLTEKGSALMHDNSVCPSNESIQNIYVEGRVMKNNSKEIPEESESNFEEFRTFYPSIVRSGFKTRRLQGNVKRCRSLYEKLLMETTHEILCQCAKAYYNEKHISGDELYMQNLETWLFQKIYLLYLPEVDQSEYNKQNNQSEDI